MPLQLSENKVTSKFCLLVHIHTCNHDFAQAQVLTQHKIRHVARISQGGGRQIRMCRRRMVVFGEGLINAILCLIVVLTTIGVFKGEEHWAITSKHFRP